MAKLEHTSISGNEVFLQLGSLAILLTMVVTVLGIKFRWFKHRLSFEPIPTTEVTGIGSAGSYRNSLNQSQLTQGVFRRRDDEENVIERPVSLPPIRVRKTSRGPPPPLLPQKRTVIPMPPGQELIPETPQIEPTTPPSFTPRNKRDKSPQKSPRIQIQEPLYEVKDEGSAFFGVKEVERVEAVKDEESFFKVNEEKKAEESFFKINEEKKDEESFFKVDEELFFAAKKINEETKQDPKEEDTYENITRQIDIPDYEEVQVKRRPTSESFPPEPEVPKRTKKHRPKSMEVSLVRVDSSNEENPPVHKPLRQKKSPPISLEDLQKKTHSEIVEQKDNLEKEEPWEVVRSVQFDVEDESDTETSFEKRDTGFVRPYLEDIQGNDGRTIHFDNTEHTLERRETEFISHEAHSERTVHFDVQEEVKEDREHPFERRDTGFIRPDMQSLQSSEKSVHFEAEEHFEHEHKFERRDTGYVRPNLENSEKTVHFDIQDEKSEEYEHKFERRDTGYVRPELSELQKSVTFEGVPDSPEDEYWEIIPRNQTKFNEVEEEDVLERKDIVPTIILLDADEMHHETEIDALSDEEEKPVVPVVPAPRRSKESSTPEEEIKPTCISFEEEEPQQIAFVDEDNKSLDSIDVLTPDYQKPKIVEFKERPKFLEVNEPEKPIPRQRSITGPAPKVPPLPKTPPPTTPDNGNDNWTAIQIHRNLTKELNSEMMAAVLKKSVAREAKVKEDIAEAISEVPLEEVEPPKNMRDMMRRKRDEYEFSGF